MSKRALLRCLWLFLGLGLYGESWAQPIAGMPAEEGTPYGEYWQYGQYGLVKVAEEPISIGELFHLSPEHLFVLGAGIIVGVTVIGPYFDMGEVAGIALGVITGAFAYQIWQPEHHSFWGWF
jgi:F0F1-type ATP synthase membrane subunit c/vacuolar-type H+-ATPase subunit K